MKTFEEFKLHDKEFEEYNIPEYPTKKYWNIVMDDNFQIALFKIGMPDGRRKDFEEIVDFSDIFVSYTPDRIAKPGRWDWDISNKWFEERNYNYMGEVEVTPEDIEKYNMYIQTTKYNL